MPDQPVIYLDHNATTPVDPRVVEAMEPYLRNLFGNPSSSHAVGKGPSAAVLRAREQVAALLGGTDPGEVVFTGSGTEADHLAIRGTVRAADTEHPHVITQATEHPAVLAACRQLEADGVRVTVLPVDEGGSVSPRDLRSALTPGTVIVSIMHANNETGTIQPIAELARVTHEGGALFHTDAAQSVAKIPVDVRELEVDLLTVVGHKMYAPKGVGALYVRRGVPIAPLIDGGGQEGGLRAGTENVPYLVGLGAACRIAAEGQPDLARLRDLLHDRLVELLPDRIVVNGDLQHRLPNTLNVSVLGTRGDKLLSATPGIAASTGAACHSDAVEVSPVLTAMGIGSERAKGAIRLSLGRMTSETDVRDAATQLARSTASR